MTQNESGEVIEILIPAPILFSSFERIHIGWEDQFLFNAFSQNDLELAENIPAFLRAYRNRIRIVMDWKNLPDLDEKCPWRTLSLRKFVLELNQALGCIFFYHPWKHEDELKFFAACMTDPDLVWAGEHDATIQEIDIYLPSATFRKELTQLEQAFAEKEYETTDDLMRDPMANQLSDMQEKLKDISLYGALSDFRAFALRANGGDDAIDDELGTLFSLLEIRSEESYFLMGKAIDGACEKLNTADLNATARLPLGIKRYFRKIQDQPF